VKASVHVCRIGYGHNDLVVTIPDALLHGKTQAEIEDMFEKVALDEGGNHSFSEKDSEYTAEGVTLPEGFERMIQVAPDKPDLPFDIKSLTERDEDEFNRLFPLLQKAICDIGVGVQSANEPDRLQEALVRAYKGNAVRGTKDVICDDCAQDDVVELVSDLIKACF
jgi:hypothetical protein